MMLFSHYYFNDKAKHKFKLKKEQLTIAIPDDKKNEIDTIIEIILK